MADIINFRAALRRRSPEPPERPSQPQVHIEPHFQWVWFIADNELLTPLVGGEQGFRMQPQWARNVAKLLLRAADEAEEQDPLTEGPDDDDAG